MAALLPPAKPALNKPMERKRRLSHFLPLPHSHRSSFLIMFCTASIPSIRLYTSICISVRGQKTTSSYFLGSWSLMMSLVLHPAQYVRGQRGWKTPSVPPQKIQRQQLVPQSFCNSASLKALLFLVPSRLTRCQRKRDRLLPLLLGADRAWVDPVKERPKLHIRILYRRPRERDTNRACPRDRRGGRLPQR
jgi:hypothetical protein